jgi:hypothetical protein
MENREREIREVGSERPQRDKLSKEEIIKRMEAFPERREEFVASVKRLKD